MNRFSLLLICLLFPIAIQAQTASYRSSARLGVDMISLDAPDAMAPRYVARLARHFRNDRLILAFEGGYARLVKANPTFNTFDPGSNRRERLTADITLLWDVLPDPRHTLRLGGGLSAWYRYDDLYQGAATIGQDSFVINRQAQHRGATGGHLAAEYEWRFNPRWGLDARVRVVTLREAGTSAILGTGINYHY